jgi:hypothetical protein
MTDDYIEAGKRRVAVLEAARAAAVADIQAHRVNGDQESMAEAIQTVANLDADLANLNNLYSRYTQSQQPPPEPSKEEREARPWNRMDWQDVVNLARQSKYARDLRADDPALLEGWREAQRRRQRGE